MASTLRTVVHAIVGTVLFLLPLATVSAQHRQLIGMVRDETGAALPGVLVELRTGHAAVVHTQTDEQGRYRLRHARAGSHGALVHPRQLRRGQATGHDRQRCTADRRRHAPRAQRRRDGHRQVHLHQPRRCAGPGAGSRRHRAVRQPGRRSPRASSRRVRSCGPAKYSRRCRAS